MAKTIAFLGSGLLFVTAAALAVVKPVAQNEPPALYQARTQLQLPELHNEALTSFTAPFIDETQIRRGDTLASVLQRLDIQETGLQSFLVHEKAARSIYRLYPGRSVQAAQDDDGNLVWLRYHHTPGIREDGRFVSRWLEVQPDGDGGFIAMEQSQVADTQTRMAEGRIRSSLFAATDAAGIPDTITSQMADILGSKIDFMQDLRRGDRFRVIYETHAHNGKRVGAGRVLALEFINNGHTYNAAWFQPEQGAGGYYDFNGKNLKGTFLRTALEFSRISSTFGMRKHPIHGKWVGHQGVDYAAAAGTPIHATANGTIEFIGWQNGYGNVVILRHRNKISTLYAHQSRFAAGLAKGDTITQGQLIGYVGATGWATGPHLHYEFRVDNRPVNPLSVDLPVATALEGKDLKAFAATMAGYQHNMYLLAGLSREGTQVASSQ